MFCEVNASRVSMNKCSCSLFVLLCSAHVSAPLSRCHHRLSCYHSRCPSCFVGVIGSLLSVRGSQLPPYLERRLNASFVMPACSPLVAATRGCTQAPMPRHLGYARLVGCVHMDALKWVRSIPVVKPTAAKAVGASQVSEVSLARSVQKTAVVWSRSITPQPVGARPPNS